MKQTESRNARKYLIAHGIRPSAQRVAIMQYLWDHRTHPTAEEIYIDLLPHIPTLSKTTVYNTMKLFIQQGVALQIDIDGHNARFDGDISTHAHFQCRLCNRIFDLPQPNLRSALFTGDGFVLERFCVNMRGLCPECSRNLSETEEKAPK